MKKLEHRKRRGMGSIGDLFSGPSGIGEALGLDPQSWGMGLDIGAAAVLGVTVVKAAHFGESYYPNMIKARPWAAPLIRAAVGITAGVGFGAAKFTGSRALALGLGITLTADGMMELFNYGKAKLMSKGVNGFGEEELLYGVNGAPVEIREEQLAGAPLAIRDVSETEQQLQDFSYLSAI